MRQTLQEQLSETEFSTLVDALPGIAILIAGADGKIDEEETDWAEKLTHIRSYNHPPSLEGLYEVANESFSGQMHAFLASYPKQAGDRNRMISGELEALNPILAKLDPTTAYAVYDSLTSFARHIARSSGGFLGFGAISKQEEEWIGLPMLTPIEIVSEEEE